MFEPFVVVSLRRLHCFLTLFSAESLPKKKEKKKGDPVPKEEEEFEPNAAPCRSFNNNEFDEGWSPHAILERNR